MPTLKQISCSIEFGPSNTKLKEYGARYSDGHVETFVAVPDSNIPFTIYLKSEGYIAPGLAFFVYMDGEYQCNRNRVCLKLPGEGVQLSEYETEFRVRQKEEKTSFGTFVARDWTFAKLNRVAADKAPNLNPQFTNNVGTIEIIVLRCKTDLDDIPSPKASRAHIAHKTTSIPDAKRSSARAPAASAKAADQQQSEIGGLFGLFDGAFDGLNLDGAADEQPVRRDGRVKPEPPPGMAWDSIVGMWIPEDAYGPPPEFDVGDPEDAMAKQIKAVEEEINRTRARIEEARAQYDGAGGQPGVVINQWGDRGRDDMRGDKYLGLKDQDRSAYKQYMRETGESVSSLTDHFPNRNPRLRNDPSYPPSHVIPPRFRGNSAPVNRPQTYVPLQPNPQQVGEELARMRQEILEFMQKYPGADHTKAKRELALVTRLQRLQQEGQGSLVRFPLWLTEVLTDMEIRGQYTLRVQQKCPHVDFSWLMNKLEKDRMEVLRDPMYQKDFSFDDVDDVSALCYMLYEREETFKKFLKSAENFSNVSTEEVRARIDFIHSQREQADDAVKGLVRRAKARVDAQQAQAQTIQGCSDGANNYPGQQQLYNRWINSPPQGANKRGWQQVGLGTWKPDQQFDQNQPQPMNGQDFGAGQQAAAWKDKEASSGWGRPGQDQGEGPQNESWCDSKKPQSQNADGNSPGWPIPSHHSTASSRRNKSTGKNTYEHDLSSNNSRGNRSCGTVQKSSTRQSNKDNQWDDSKGDWKQSSNNQDWGGPGEPNDAGDNGWGGESRQKTKSKSRSIQTVINTKEEDPKVYIKPYWKDWNKPFSRSESPDSNAKKYRDEPREVCNYPASTVPAVPEKEAKDASHAIQTSKGADYSHKCRKPVYIDTMEQPYSVFSFKYRSKEALEKILKFKIDEVDVKKVQEQVEKDRLMIMPKHKLIEELMEKRTPPNHVSKKSATSVAGKGVSGRGNDNLKSGDNANSGWGVQNKQSERSHSGSNHNSRGNKSSQNKNLSGWDDTKVNNAPLKFGDKGNKGSKNGWDDSPVVW